MKSPADDQLVGGARFLSTRLTVSQPVRRVRVVLIGLAVRLCGYRGVLRADCVVLCVFAIIDPGKGNWYLGKI